MTTFAITPDHLILVIEIFKKICRFIQACGYLDLDLLIDCQGKKLSDFTLIQLKEDVEESDLPYKVDLLDWHQLTDAFKKHSE